MLLNLAMNQNTAGAYEPIVALLNDGLLRSRLDHCGVSTFILDEKRLSFFSITTRLRELQKSHDVRVLHSHRKKEHIAAALSRGLDFRRVLVRTEHGAPEHFPSFIRLAARTTDVLNRLSAQFVANQTVAVSDDLAKVLSKGLPPNRITVIPNGIDIASRPFEPRAVLPVRTVAFIGRIVAVKRVDLFLEVARHLEHMRPGCYRFLVVGDGPLRDILESSSDAQSVSHLNFTGFVDDIPALLRQVDVVCFTSDHEGMPMTALEAMAQGTIVAARSVGGLTDLLDDGCGLLAPGTDTGQLATQINGLLDDQGALEDTQRRARSRIETGYSVDIMRSRYDSLYTELLNAAS